MPNETNELIFSSQLMLPLFHTLYLEATANCNLSCQYCMTNSSKEKKSNDIPFDLIVSRILVPAWELGTRHIEFSGGEFLCRPDAYDILEFSAKTGFKCMIVTNGTTINQTVIDKVRSICGDSVVFSMGINSVEGLNNQTRDIALESTLRTIQLIQNNGLAVNITVTIGKYNLDEVETIFRTIDELKLPFNRLPVIPRSHPCQNMMFDKNDMKSIIHPALTNYFRGYFSYTPFFLNPADYHSISRTEETEVLIPTNPSVGCWVGSLYGINAQGEVAPCPLLLDHVSGGNVLEKDLRDILFESELFSKIVRRENLGGKCGTCKFKFTCGGCRAMALYTSGDVFAEDPTCFIDELSPIELNELESQTSREFRKYQIMTKFSSLFGEDKNNIT